MRTSLRLAASIAGRDVALTATHDEEGGTALEGGLVFGHDDLQALVETILPRLAPVIPSFESQRWLTLTVSMGGQCQSFAAAIASVDERGGKGKSELGVVAIRGADDLTIMALTNETPIGVPEIPLVSDLLGAFSASDLRVAYASKSFKREDLAGLPASTRDAVLARGLEAGAGGISFGAMLGTPESRMPLAFPPAPPPAAGDEEVVAEREADEDTEPTEGMRFWLDVDKRLGPVHIRRIGGELEMQEQRVGLLLDAALELSSLRFGLSGLALSLCPFEQNKAVRFDLDGLDLAFKGGPVEISGALLRIKDPETPEFAGMAMIKAQAFTITGLGSYALIKGKDGGPDEPSLFVFAILDADLGGPPFFHVKGLAAGFGYNRRFNLPPIEEVHRFPLIEAAASPGGPGGGGAAKTGLSTELLTRVRRAFPAERGQYWVAAGVKFTSFEMIDSFALLSVAFGTEVVISVLGLSKLAVPKQIGSGTVVAKPIVYAELALKASLMPERGLLTVEARLTPNSYVFSPACKLTGGFAFYAWFQGTHGHEGDFVLTLGGYHPMFEVPDHYPLVPRVALTWQVSRQLRIHGECYFALTPSCLMAGGQLCAVFQDGGLRAWFDVYAHFFISWAPLQYDAQVGVSIGVSYHTEIAGISTTFSVELSATAHIWGPPFEGKARITWLVISFTVYFGNTRESSAPPPLTWDEFDQAFLPRPSPQSESADPLTIVILDGAIRNVEDEDGKVIGVVVNPHELKVLVKSAIPSKTIKVQDTSDSDSCRTLSDKPHWNLGIQPMHAVEPPAKMRLESELIVKLRSSTSARVSLDDSTDAGCQFHAACVTQNVPEALWGAEPFDIGKKPRESILIPDVPTGVRLRPVVGAEQTIIERWCGLDNQRSAAALEMAALERRRKDAAGDVDADLEEELAAMVESLRAIDEKVKDLERELENLKAEDRLLVMHDPAKLYECLPLPEIQWAYRRDIPNTKEPSGDLASRMRAPPPDVVDRRHDILAALSRWNMFDLPSVSREQAAAQMTSLALHAEPMECGVGLGPAKLTTAEKEWRW